MRSLLNIPAALAMVATPALAQSADAGSQATNSVNVVAVTGDTGSSRIHSEGTMWTTPTVLGSSFGGANPCLIGQGVGAAGGPIGFSVSIGKSDQSCTRRNDAAAFNAIGMMPVAVALMCQPTDKKNPYANADAFFAGTGKACPGTDRSRYKLADGSLAPYWSAGQ